MTDVYGVLKLLSCSFDFFEDPRNTKSVFKCPRSMITFPANCLHDLTSHFQVSHNSNPFYKYICYASKPWSFLTPKIALKKVLKSVIKTLKIPKLQSWFISLSFPKSKILELREPNQFELELLTNHAQNIHLIFARYCYHDVEYFVFDHNCY